MPILISVKINPGFQQIGRKARAAHKKMMDQKRESMRLLGRALVIDLQKEAPKGKTGKFAKGHSYKTFEVGDKIEMRAYIPKPIGDWIRFGTKPHAIVAKGRALKFLWEKGPKSNSEFTAFHFYKRVWHPGTKPNRYDIRAKAKWQPKAIVELRKMARVFVITLVE